MFSRHILAIALVLGMVITPACPAAASGDPSLTKVEMAGIRDLDRRFVDAYNRLDVDGFMDCLWNSPNLAVLLYDGTVFIGWDAVRGY